MLELGERAEREAQAIALAVEDSLDLTAMPIDHRSLLYD
jgi:hypothetical protein